MHKVPFEREYFASLEEKRFIIGLVFIKCFDNFFQQLNFEGDTTVYR